MKIKVVTSNKSKGKGKSGGLRIITNIVLRINNIKENEKIIGLVTIYDKSEYENISENELKDLINELKRYSFESSRRTL